MNEDYISQKEAAELCRVTTRTLFNWYKQDKVRCIRSSTGIKRYHKQDLYNIIGFNTHTEKTQKKYCYCRVSSRHEVDDLGRQIQFFESQYPDHIIIKDCGSGINWKRKGLKTILEQSMQGNVQEIVVAHRDRLCRFAFELIEFILEKNHTKLIVLDEIHSQSKNEELADDIMSIIQVYACRRNGRRRYKNKKSKDISNKITEEKIEAVVRSQ